MFKRRFYSSRYILNGVCLEPLILIKVINKTIKYWLFPYWYIQPPGAKSKMIILGSLEPKDMPQIFNHAMLGLYMYTLYTFLSYQ